METKEFVLICCFLRMLCYKTNILYCLKLGDCNCELPIKMPYSVLSCLHFYHVFISTFVEAS